MSSVRQLERVLIVDDDLNDRLLAIHELRREFPDVFIQEAVSWDEFKSTLDDDFDVVITDYDLRWSTGMEILTAVRQQYPDKPVIMFTDSGSQEIAVEAMKAGLNDYVLKSPKHMVRLSQAVRSVWENTQIRRRTAELEFRLGFLLDELEIGVFRATLDGQLLEASEGLQKLIGVETLSDVEAFFRNHIIVDTEDQSDVQKYRQEVQIIDINGRSRWLQVSEAIVESYGRTFIDGLVSDITDRKEKDKELRSLNATLEQQVTQRTSRLETLNKELETFAFSVSHDLRSPIRQIEGFVTLLIEQLQQQLTQLDPLDESAVHYLERIQMLTQRSGQMIDDLLQFSRTGRAEMHYTQVSMNRLVQEVIRQVQQSSSNRKIHWQIDPLPAVWGDRNLLHKVWQNLIENAVKYTCVRAEADISIGSELRQDEAIFFICDNGIGFSMSEIEHLFGVFQRLSNAEKFEGTGVGLANVQRVIHRHGGRLWAEGQIDQGATFYFSIPVVENH
ncbi:ATP-binding protein [Oscillatoria sp. CS-180]|uniref:sensor histidine kinase n=1 Tax=Oscillatoria sp. CS-180 TaxID=3021720 RepID=UPI00232E512C|nr:ATP-binding protein [Oscillatoria sp. CS-180]MDB9529112.1 ATP-binding protein [Oscillatoria sp. CS-180]